MEILQVSRECPEYMSRVYVVSSTLTISVKHVQKLASECDSILCTDFIHQISWYPKNYLICLDEVSKDDCMYTCLWGLHQISTILHGSSMNSIYNSTHFSAPTLDFDRKKYS